MEFTNLSWVPGIPALSSGDSLASKTGIRCAEATGTFDLRVVSESTSLPDLHAAKVQCSAACMAMAVCSSGADGWGALAQHSWGVSVQHAVHLQLVQSCIELLGNR